MKLWRGVKMSRKWKKICSVFLVILPFWVTPTLADEDLDRTKRWQEGKVIARETLKNFVEGMPRVEKAVDSAKEKEMEKAKNYMEILGFKSDESQKAFLSAPDPLADMKVDDPFGVYYVRLDDLRKYPPRPESNPWDLLIRTNGVMYPIVVHDPVKDAQVQSAVTLLDRGSGKGDKPQWELLEIGSSKEIKLFTDARADVLKEKKADPFVIFIPALSEVLLGIKDSDNFKVKILNLDEKSSSSDFRPADEVFKNLAERAKTTNYDLPPRG